MEALARLADDILDFLRSMFYKTFILEEFDIIVEPQKIRAKDYNAIHFNNAGEVTVFINGTLSIPPDSFYVSSNLPRQYFLADYQITFDDADSLGKNTGTIKRLEIVRKYEQGANYN